MNVNTGELFRMSPEMEKELARRFSERDERFKEMFKPVPVEFSEEVEQELNGQDRGLVDMTKGTPLVKWAKSQQSHKGPNRKQRRQMAKESRRKNRG
ncbi:hypothetical protein [Aminipila terrae]|uniref:Uncharacterized protein n=1 Tax=Aminipila terrae TaxID=2697030 RepID=A0A6P1MI53_9FIRM|nr:hypothetical protein [Aminipila terrae]QHI72873.1 hypothetical protein Ami3637_11065 [Aminipila terrae]